MSKVDDHLVVVFDMNRLLTSTLIGLYGNVNNKQIMVKRIYKTLLRF